MAKRQRSPVARIRAAIAGVDLFFPNKSLAGKRRKVKKFLRRVRVGSPAELEKLRVEGAMARTKTDFLLRTEVFGTEEELRKKLNILHELSHFFDLGKNDSITANAFNGYFSYFRMSRRFSMPKDRYLLWLRDAEQIIKGPKYLKNGRYEHDKASGFGHAGTDIATIGGVLGVFAADKERQWKKPASGLFLIREICNGKPVDTALKEIESGKLDKEITAFAKKHFGNLFS